MPLRIKHFINKHGELFAVRRGSVLVKAKGLVRDDERPSYVAFEVGTDIQRGDVLRGETSGNVHEITRVDTDVVHGRPFQLRAFIKVDSPLPQSAIHIGSMVNSAIQQNSPSATQTITISNEFRQSAKAIVSDLNAALPDLGLSEDDFDEVSAELATIDAQLKLSKPRSSVIVDSFNHIKTLLETTAAVGGSWVFIRDIIPRIVELLN